MTYILCALGLSSLLNLVLLYLMGKVVLRNSDGIRELRSQQQESSLVAP